MVDAVTSRRTDRAAALAAWADDVDPADLRPADRSSLRKIAALAQERDRLDLELIEAVETARSAGRSWSEIGLMLGVSKQAAQRKYGTRSPA